MKKVLALGLAMIGVLGLTGCEQIQRLISGEKQYNYNDYRAMLADRKLSFSATKCASIIDNEGEKTSRNYTYDKDDKEWKYTYSFEILGETTTLTSSRSLDIVAIVKTCEISAALLEKEVDELFKFYATSNSYRFTGQYKDSEKQVELEYKFGADGLITNSYEKSTDLKEVKATTKTEKFEYSE